MKPKKNRLTPTQKAVGLLENAISWLKSDSSGKESAIRSIKESLKEIKKIKESP